MAWMAQTGSGCGTGANECVGGCAAGQQTGKRGTEKQRHGDAARMETGKERELELELELAGAALKQRW